MGIETLFLYFLIMLFTKNEELQKYGNMEIWKYNYKIYPGAFRASIFSTKCDRIDKNSKNMKSIVLARFVRQYPARNVTGQSAFTSNFICRNIIYLLWIPYPSINNALLFI